MRFFSASGVSGTAGAVGAEWRSGEVMVGDTPSA
jgi:hypothetical protein